MKVKTQPITISEEVKQRLKLGAPQMLKSYIELGINRTAGYTSASGVSRMVELIAIDSKKVSSCPAVLEGKYGDKEINMGVRVALGKQGISRIIELDLSQDEKKNLEYSAGALETKAQLVGNLQTRTDRFLQFSIDITVSIVNRLYGFVYLSKGATIFTE